MLVLGAGAGVSWCWVPGDAGAARKLAVSLTNCCELLRAGQVAGAGAGETGRRCWCWCW